MPFDRRDEEEEPLPPPQDLEGYLDDPEVGIPDDIPDDTEE